MERRLAAIMDADVVGYSRLIRSDEDGTLAALKSVLTDLIGPKIAEHHGRVVKFMGDGVLAEFASVVEAVRAAAEMQQALAERNEVLPKGQRIAFRIGVNLGDVVIDGDDIHGDGVNVAARLEGLAEPGGVCVSAAVYDQVRDRIELPFEDLGEQRVKNIDRPVRVWRWVRDTVASLPKVDQTNMPLPERPSIVVLPFNNMSRDAEQEYFSDGITEDVITDLSKASGLFVIARNSAFVYKDKTFSVPHVCRELGVKFALEGSIRKVGNRVRVTAQLIDGSSGGHLWAERYDRELTDIFAVQDDITQQIVTALKVTLSEAEKSRIVDGGTNDVNAHDLFLRGRELIRGVKKDREMFDQATACFRRAIELDPNYAAPYAGLGMAYVLDHQNRWSETPESSLDQAERFSSWAIARDDQDPYAHLVASLVAMFRMDYQRWADEADRALSLNPNFAPALNARGVVHIYTGQPEMAVPYIERAMRLDPAVQQQYVHFLGTAYFVAGDYETAVALFRDRIAINPTTDLSRAFLASALGHLGKLDEAGEVWRELKEINPRYSPVEHIGRLPFRDSSDAEKFTVGLRKAGLVQ
ncbi:adenylate/guanylate cyclase domain-containing protein [Mesorhizobium sp.]|uniref:adenylate/guanylate cyclase domain-containing protein n=2 Tax=Mesorhizobium sp. TaxID=1871066 RepID=UPI001205C0F5|nr:adenylate/guanylate cyclase domain-containing protein [Mesorhizobium sp.]TIS60041.1 MAG: adenylate/guanylate cyclase domain-containing protein [Mesorhizobium sp.]TIS89559.1 MAG: adenylate/guanylate cyclase domain-containing protein [Mesorhizobium sp.]